MTFPDYKSLNEFCSRDAYLFHFFLCFNFFKSNSPINEVS